MVDRLCSLDVGQEEAKLALTFFTRIFAVFYSLRIVLRGTKAKKPQIGLT
jgi:hypothetical protein